MYTNVTVFPSRRIASSSWVYGNTDISRSKLVQSSA